MTLPERPTTSDALTAHLELLKDAVKGKIVLVGVPRQVLVTFSAPALRRDDAAVLRRLDAPPAAPQPRRQREQQEEDQRESRPLTNRQLQEQLNQFLVASGALVRINDAGPGSWPDPGVQQRDL